MYDWKDLRKIRAKSFAETRVRMDEILAEGHKRLYVNITIDEEFTPEGYIKASVKGRLKRAAKTTAEYEEMKSQTPWKEEQRKQRRRMTSKIDRIRDLFYGICTEDDIGRFGPYMPHFSLKVDHDIIDILEEIPEVVHIVPQRVFVPDLQDAWQTVRIQTSWDFGYNGDGKSVAIIDTGVDRTHPMLSGRVIEEVCFSTGADCPNNTSYQVGVGAATPRMDLMAEAYHGTHVAGIAAGDGLYRGMAWGANILAINVFSQVGEGAGAYSADILSGMNAAYNWRDTGLAAVNLSLGSGGYEDFCDSADPAMTSIVSNMTSSGIAVVVAAGNASTTQSIEGTAKRQISFPACITEAISIGAVTKTSHIAPAWSLAWNNPGQPGVDMYAPGYNITSAYPDNQYAVSSGTSMAAPFLTGIIAVLRAIEEGRDSNMDVETLLSKLQDYADWAYDTDAGGLSVPWKRLVQVDDFVFSEFEYKVAPPQMSPSRGGYNRPFDVKIYSNRVGALVRYTDNGLDPSPIYGTLISPEDRVRITKRTTLRAIAYSPTSEFLPSAVSEGLYDVWQSDDTSIGVPEDDTAGAVSRAVRKSPGLLEYPDTRFVRIVDFSQNKMPENFRENARPSGELEPILFNVRDRNHLDPVYEQPFYNKMREWQFPVDLCSDGELLTKDTVPYVLMVVRSPGAQYKAHPFVASGESFKDFGINVVSMCAHTSFHDLGLATMEGRYTPDGEELSIWAKGDQGLLDSHPITRGLYKQLASVSQFGAASKFQALLGTPDDCYALFHEGIGSLYNALVTSQSFGTNDPRYAHWGGTSNVSGEGWRLFRRTLNWTKTPGDSRILGESLLSKIQVLQVGDKSTLCVSARSNIGPASLKVTPMVLDLNNQIVGILESKDISSLASLRVMEPPRTYSGELHVSLDNDARSADISNNFASPGYGIYVGSNPGNGNQWYKIYIRFSDVPIPPKASIVSAQLVVEGMNSFPTSPVHTRISCYALGNCPPLDAASPYPFKQSGYVYSPAGLWIDWMNIPDSVPGVIYRSPDISKLLQYSIDRPDWQKGQAVGLLITDQSMEELGTEWAFTGIGTRSTAGALRSWKGHQQSATTPRIEVTWKESEQISFPTTVQKWDVAGAHKIGIAITDYSNSYEEESVMMPEINAWII